MPNAEDIAKLAKEIWAVRGKPEGRDIENWNIAMHLQKIIDDVRCECDQKMYFCSSVEKLILELRSSRLIKITCPKLFKDIKDLAEKIETRNLIHHG